MVGKKSRSQDSSFQALAETFYRIVDRKRINQLAYETGFCQRRSKVQGDDFFSACVFFANSIAKETLVELSVYLEKQGQISISPQGLHERFNERTVSFLEQFLKQLIQTDVSKETTLLNENSVFKRIRIIDSTAFILDSAFVDEFPGSGGTRHTAGAKIQLEYDLISGRILEKGSLEHPCRN